MIFASHLDVFWYIVILLCIIGYATLDGFDLGVGILHLFTKEDYERRVFLNAIGPVWDGNTVWLVVIVGGLFAGFPYAYSALFSAFYTPMMIFLAGLIFRAVAIEFRSKKPSKLWRNTWDTCFFLGSMVIALGAGILVGNLIQGIPIDKDQVYLDNFIDFLTPYPLLIGVFAVACFMMHGCLYLVMKTERELHDKLCRWVNPTVIFFIICYAITTMATLIYQPHMIVRIQERPLLFIVAIVSALTIANIPREIHRKRDRAAFLSSCLSIALLLTLYAIGTFPTLLRSSIDPVKNSLYIHNSDASPMTLSVLLVIVAIGIPLVLVYGFIVYRVFSGKVKVDPYSY